MVKLFSLVCSHAIGVHLFKLLSCDVIDVSVSVDGTLLIVLVVTVSLADDSLDTTGNLLDRLMSALFFLLLFFRDCPRWRGYIEARDRDQHKRRHKVRVLAMARAILGLKSV